jgi:hypothetical protein
VAPEVAPGQLGQRLLAAQVPARWQPLVRQRQAVPRRVADDPVGLRALGEQGQPAGGGDAGRLEPLAQLRPGQLPAARERVADDLVAARFTQARFDFARLADMADDCVQRLQTVSRHANHSGIVCRNFPSFDQLLRDADRHAASGFGENAFMLREQFDSFADFIVGHVVGCASGFLHHA